MKDFIIENQILIFSIYGISLAFLIACYIMEKKITVLELIISLVIFLIPFVNVLILGLSVLDVLDRREIISLSSWRAKIMNFLNLRLK